MSENSDQALERAEAIFKKKEAQLREGQQAMAEYEAKREAERAKTARLRALRLARDATAENAKVREVRKRPAPKAPG